LQLSDAASLAQYLIAAVKSSAMERFSSDALFGIPKFSLKLKRMRLIVLNICNLEKNR